MPDQTDQTDQTDLPAHVVRLLDHHLRDAQIASRLPSVVAAIFDGTATTWVGCAGRVDGSPPTADTQYRIGSITKTLVAVGVMRLRDEGLLGLNDPIADHIHDGDTLKSHDLGAASVGQMLMHAGGTPAETVGPWWERAPGADLPALLQDLVGRPAAGQSGRRFHYSNVGFGLLGGVLARYRGKPWSDVVQSEILTPLGMHRTTTRPATPAAAGLAVHPWADAVLAEPEHDAGAMAPAGQLWASLDDMVTWGQFLGGRSSSVLKPSTLREMSVPGMVVHMPGEAWTAAHGLGLQVFNVGGTVTIGHGGSMPGFLASVRTDPDGGPGVVVMANTTAGMDPGLGTTLLDIARDHLPDRRSPWTPTPLADETAQIVGVWYWGPRPHVLRSTPDGLHLAPMQGSGRESRFLRTEAGWIGQDGYYAGERLTVVRHEDGSPRHLDLASFILTRTPYDPRADVPGGVDDDGWGDSAD